MENKSAILKRINQLEKMWLQREPYLIDWLNSENEKTKNIEPIVTECEHILTICENYENILKTN